MRGGKGKGKGLPPGYKPPYPIPRPANEGPSGRAMWLGAAVVIGLVAVVLIWWGSR